MSNGTYCLGLLASLPVARSKESRPTVLGDVTMLGRQWGPSLPASARRQAHREGTRL